MDAMRIIEQSRRALLGVAIVAGIALGAGSLTACESQQQRVTQREDLLSAAGFIVLPANTPDRQTMLHRLPAHTFVQRVNGDVVHYVYADPLVCDFLYVGSKQAYTTYKRHK